jgi:hypothetical protein
LGVGGAFFLRVGLSACHGPEVKTERSEGFYFRGAACLSIEQ